VIERCYSYKNNIYLALFKDKMATCLDSAYASANCTLAPGCSEYTGFYKDPEGQWGLLAIASIVATGMAFFIGRALIST